MWFVRVLRRRILEWANAPLTVRTGAGGLGVVCSSRWSSKYEDQSGRHRQRRYRESDSSL